MPITHDAELPIKYEPVTGPGVDALANRKEEGSPVDLEGSIKLPSKAWFARMAENWGRIFRHVR